MERNYLLDSLRGIASLMVVFFHLNEPILFVPNIYTQTVKLGWLGVPVFFIISGYCIWMVAIRSKHPVEFLNRRIFRIVPPYYFSLLVVLMAILTLKIVQGVNDATPFPNKIQDIAITLALMTEPVSSVKTVNWVYWSLTYEIVFYLVITAALFLKKGALLVLIALTTLSFFPFQNFKPLFFLSLWPLFSLGLSLFGIVTKQNPRPLFYVLFLLSFVSMILCQKMEVCITASITILLIYLNERNLLRLNKENWISRIGIFSYSLYLIHVPIGCYLLIRLRTGILLSNLFLHILFDVFAVAVCVGFSYLMFRFIELPGIELGKRFNQKLFSR